MIGTCAVDQRIDASPFLIHSLDPFDSRFGVGNIALQGRGTNAVRLDGIDHFVRFAGAGTITDRDGPALGGQIQRHSTTDPARAPGNQSDSSYHTFSGHPYSNRGSLSNSQFGIG